MPLSKLVFKPGINRDQTSYASEGGWYECDKIRFRSGFPEKIGGWVKYNVNEFYGVCRSLFNWVTSDGANLMGIGTNSHMYVEAGGNLYDITPIRSVSIQTLVSGLSATGEVGSVAVGTVAPDGNLATGAIGTVTITGVASFSVSGNVSAVEVGSVTVTNA